MKPFHHGALNRMSNNYSFAAYTQHPFFSGYYVNPVLNEEVFALENHGIQKTSQKFRCIWCRCSMGEGPPQTWHRQFGGCDVFISFVTTCDFPFTLKVPKGGSLSNVVTAQMRQTLTCCTGIFLLAHTVNAQKSSSSGPSGSREKL